VRKGLGNPLTWLAASSTAAVVMVALFVIKLLSPHASAQAPSGLSGGFLADIVIPPKTNAAPDFSLSDQAGQSVSLSDLHGKVLAITFLDSHCKQLCPLEADQLAQVQRSLGAKDSPPSSATSRIKDDLARRSARSNANDQPR